MSKKNSQTTQQNVVETTVEATATQQTVSEPKFTADGRRMLTKAYSGQKEMLADGWTQDQINALITAERSTPDVANPEAWTPLNDGTDNVSMPENGTWRFPKVDGYAVCGTSLLTAEEKARYRAYIKSKDKGTSHRSMSAEDKAAAMAKWDSLIAQLASMPNSDEALAMAKELQAMYAPKAAIPAAYKKLTGRDTIDDTRWTWYGFMYASPDGEKEPSLTKETLLAKLEAGWQPVVLQKDIRALLDTCKEKGLKLDESPLGVQFSL